ncbi:hypothetical protein [Methylobacterium komagatae]
MREFGFQGTEDLGASALYRLAEALLQRTSRAFTPLRACRIVEALHGLGSVAARDLQRAGRLGHPGLQLSHDQAHVVASGLRAPFVVSVEPKSTVVDERHEGRDLAAAAQSE